MSKNNKANPRLVYYATFIVVVTVVLWLTLKFYTDGDGQPLPIPYATLAAMFVFDIVLTRFIYYVWFKQPILKQPVIEEIEDDEEGE